MVGHQAISQHFDLPFLAILAQPFQIDMPVLILKKDIFSAVASLGDMMGYIAENISG